MKCNDIQQNLSAYVEGIIPSEEKMIIDEHLKSCVKCYESLADLKKTIAHIHNLEDVEPPAWLTQKVMARIKAEAEPKKGILQKLFYPLHIKLPIEAVAATLVAVLTIYIFKTMQPEMKLAQAPSKIETVISRSSSKVDDEAISKEKIASPLARNDGNKLLPSSPPLEKGPMARSQRLIEGKGGFEAEYSVPLKKPAPMDKLEETPPPMQKQDEVRPLAGAVAKEEVKTEVLSRATKAKVMAIKKEAINITIHVKDIKTAREEIEKTLKQLEGKIIKTESFENHEIVTAEINSQQFQEFITSLKSISDVEEKKVDFQGLERNIEISIEIMKEL
jgi:hypothetical protein